ncbi:acyl-CoA dehydrogenase family protein [Caulobacter sp. S45]|uniref:acyl-CoA dehydrogenase family protein n=1 Tax=Caulobacter sp. S45 TaxID=1641861 RepID=UPI00131E011D|nr:acyl-CoA dehydrogenase family protein [Caulobacter sp. S45]
MNAISLSIEVEAPPLVALVEALDELAMAAAACDRTGAFPAEGVAILRRIGVLDAFAGLAESQALELFDALRLIGRADLSLGRIFEGHVNAVRLIDWYGDEAQKRTLAEDIAQRRLFGVWATEPPPGVRILDTPEGPMLDGAKSFATGALAIQRAIITARAVDGHKHLVIAPVTAERADASGWRTRGMRATGSGLYDFTGVAVSPSMRLGGVGDYEREPRFTGGAWRFTAVQLGGVEQLVILLRDHMRRSGAADDPVQRAHFARAVVQARTANLWVREAARLTAAQDVAAVPLTSMTRGVVERAGLEVMEIVARAIGTRAFFDDQEVDRITRDLGLYLRQAHPDKAVDRAAESWLEADPWRSDPWW